MRVLITGASGVVGGRLIEHLLVGKQASVDVRAGSRVERVWPAGVQGAVIDLDQPATIDAACRDVDAVINLASMDERRCAADPQGALRANAGGTLAVAQAASRAGVGQFVQLSTYKVYGNLPAGLITEETITRPQSHYSITHRAAEDYALSQHQNTVVFRLANGFGAPNGPCPECWSIIVNGMCREAALDRRITIRSSGRSWRNFIPMRDVVRALSAAARGFSAGTYNLGSPRSMTLHDLAKEVAETCRDTLGFLPEVAVGAPVEGEETRPLDFAIGKLQAAGIGPSGSLTEEIGATLRAAAELRHGI